MHPLLDEIGGLGVIPVVVIDEPADAPALVAALADGGLPVAEFTFRTAAAAEAIRAATAARPDALIGAGTVTTPSQVDAAVAAGARFIVSPGLDEDVVRRTLELGALPLPGCATATDMMRARRLGIDVVKFFPAEAAGGIAMMRALAAPFPGLRFVPTGGIDLANMDRYLADRRVLAVGGSWMVRPDLLRGGDWAAVTQLAAAAVRGANWFALAHVGMSTADAEDADLVARRFAALFGFDVKPGNSSIFASPGIEVVKGPSRGRLGHIAIRTASVPRAVAYLARNGVAVDPASEKRAPDGSVKAVYLVEEVAGFAIHLLAED
jgi:2-dehydro-3-deoxyphosphogluconate aldolase/(4S)-4-hydroxy-2-oxoglutarate aldolase